MIMEDYTVPMLIECVAYLKIDAEEKAKAEKRANRVAFATKSRRRW